MDIDGPTEDDRRLLERHVPLSRAGGRGRARGVHHPKVESYDGFLYLILHEIVAARGRRRLVTQDIDFFLTPNFLVTVHHGPSRAIAAAVSLCLRHARCARRGAGRVCCTGSSIDIVDGYRPEVDILEARLEALEQTVFERPERQPAEGDPRPQGATWHRCAGVALPQRDAVGRLARREFPEIPEPMAYRFRDVYDHLVRLTDEAAFFQDRVTGLLDAYLSNQSNRLNQVMKVLTVICHHLHAAHGADRHVRHERRPAAVPGGR